MEASVREILDSYDAQASLENAWTIPAPWYVDERIAELERRTVFSKTWQPIGRTDQVAQPGQYVTAVLAGEPVVVVRGEDGVLRGFFNVCRHHAASVMTEPEGKAPILRCPYHGWTYSLAGELKGTPDFAGVCGFDKGQNGLVPVETAVWEKFVFVRLEPGGPSLEQSLGPLVAQFAKLGLDRFHFVERRRWTFECNWKVFVDNYLDGGYHVPHLHKGLSSVLDYSGYTIETGENWCLQWSPIDHSNAEGDVAAVRKGDRALYYWIWPNFMINWYEGVMDTNLVRPLGAGRAEVIFDFFFTDVSTLEAIARNRASIDVGNRVQDEDLAICDSVQRGLGSRAYRAGRLSVRREGGELLFHRLLAAQLKAGLGRV
jgi:choline monooxygenase